MYTTQMDAAKQGIVTEEMKKVAAKENIAVEELVKLIAKGQVIIPANKNHKCIDPEGIGSMLSLELQETAWIWTWRWKRLMLL